MNFIRLAFFALTLLAAGHGSARTYPGRAIRILVGFTPGSATDISARMFAQKLSNAWAVPVTDESPGTGTPQHIAGEVLKRVAGIDIVHVPYRGANFADVIAGRVTMTFQNAGSILPTVREGKLRPLAVTSLRRSPNMPEFPTM